MEKKRVLILDDDENRHKEFKKYYWQYDITHVYDTESAFTTLFKEEPFDIIQLDHDLIGTYCPSDDNSGYAVAKMIVSMWGGKPQGSIIIHSYNPKGVKNMLALFVDKGIPVLYRPFGKW